MKKDNVIKRFKNSIYNTRKMATYGKEGFGRAILYTLLLCLFLGGIKSVYSGMQVGKIFNNFSELLEEDKYEFKIKDGELDIKSSPVQGEYSGVMVYANDELSLEDSSEIKNILINEDAYILFLKDGMKLESSNGYGVLPTQEIKYKDGGLNNVNNKDVVNSLVFVKAFTVILTIIVTLVTTFINYLIDAAIVALFATITMLIYRIKLKYSELLSLVIYAATLPNIIVLIFNMLAPNYYFRVVGIIGTLLYTVLILKEIKKDKINKVV